MGPKSGGVVYIRWGRTTCPSTGAELLYEGIAGGSHWILTQVVEQTIFVYLKFLNISVLQYHLTNHIIYMVLNMKELITFFHQNMHHNAPCAVCYTSSKSTKLMIPAQTTCPKSWTLQNMLDIL